MLSMHILSSHFWEYNFHVISGKPTFALSVLEIKNSLTLWVCKSRREQETMKWGSVRIWHSIHGMPTHTLDSHLMQVTHLKQMPLIFQRIYTQVNGERTRLLILDAHTWLECNLTSSKTVIHYGTERLFLPDAERFDDLGIDLGLSNKELRFKWDVNMVVRVTT